MDLTSGITVIGYGIFRTKKSWTLGTEPIVVNMIMQNFTDSGGVASTSGYLGLKNDLTSATANRVAAFYRSNTGAWSVRTKTLAGAGEADLVTVANGDLLTIVATSSSVEYYINGVHQVTHTADIPTTALYCGGAVHSYNVDVVSQISFSVDLLSFKGYK